MESVARFVLAGFVVVVASLANAGDLAELRLSPRHQVGDRFTLSLDATTQTRALSRSPATDAAGEQVRLRYDASVVILEVDDAGASLRERHEGARLRYERPDGSGSLFPDRVDYEVRRRDDGSARIFVGDERIDRRHESLITTLLASQFESTLGPALLAPDRPVVIGDSWTLDRKLAKRFLREQGLRVVDFGAPATATLEGIPDSDERELRIRYQIPIAQFELAEMPRNMRTAMSDASYSGELRLGAAPRHQSHVSNLVIDMNGAVVKSGVASSFPFELRSSKLVRQRTRWAEPTVVSAR